MSILIKIYTLVAIKTGAFTTIDFDIVVELSSHGY